MLAKRWREHGDRDAAHKYLRLVARIAMGYRGYGLPISESNVGLMQAVFMGFLSAFSHKPSFAHKCVVD